jgi:signal transduction histidine kinase/ActR/RegA family two-component response regulator
MSDHLTSESGGERRVTIRGIVLCGMALIVGIAVATALMIGNFRERALLGSKHELENTVLLLSRHFDQQFEDYADAQARLAVRLAVSEIATTDEFKDRMSTFAVHTLLEAEVDGAFGSNEIRLYGADGDTVNTSESGAISTVSIADLNYFKLFKSNSTSATILAEPVRSNATSRWTISLARKIVNSDGIFLGVMTRRIDPSKFEKFFESIALRNSATVAVVHRDGELLARFPKMEAPEKEARATADLLQLLSTSDHGTSQVPDAKDYVAVLASARQMRNFPIALVATMTTSAALAPWREQTRLLIVVACLSASVIIAVFLLIGYLWSREQKRAEQRLALGKQQLHTALANMTQGLCLFDADGTLVVSNARFRELYKLREDQVEPGMLFSEIVIKHAMTDDDSAMSAAETDAQGETPRDQILRLADGSTILIRRTPTPNGGWLLTHEDISDRERVATELANRLADQLQAQKKLEAQKAELIATTGALSEARDAAEAASRAKSDFLAMMSHEIRTPMAGMMGMIDLLSGTSLDEEQQDLTRVAQESAHNLLTVLNNILDFSKLEAGQVNPESIDFSIKHSINSVISLLGPRAAGRGLKLKAILAPDLPIWLRGDPSRIGQVLLNLVGNAIKFTEHGSVQISVSHRIVQDSAFELCFDVVDTGAGIPTNVLPTLFSPFTQADGSVSRKYGGTGLGLAICKQLCLTMGGDIGVESASGRGSRFWFTVRCQLGRPPVVTALLLQPALVLNAADIDILIVEDNPIIRSLVAKLLARRGYEADQVNNGKEALEAVQAKRYGLVLMDMQMPEMDGLSATKAIRNLRGPERNVPIVALTANALVGQRETCLAAGMNSFLTKPIQPEALYDAISCWARPRRQTDSESALIPG